MSTLLHLWDGIPAAIAWFHSRHHGWPLVRTLLVTVGLGMSAANANGSTCESLAGLALPNTTIEIAQSVPAGTFIPPTGAAVPNLPAFCRVAATIRPVPDSNIRIEVWMPLAASWNHRFLGTGNGAFGGAIRYSDFLANGLRGGYATTNTDQGTFPAATTPNAGYPAGIGHPEMVIDWGWRSTHLMTVISKQIVNAYYETEPAYAYFNGCSTGGHQALSEAQRFPEDYNGIVAGSPGHDRIPLHTYFMWNAALSALNPAFNIPSSKAALINNAVLAACVGTDGGLPGDQYLNDPRDCSFDPAVLQCSAGDQPTCLTQSQVQALRLAYQGPRNPRTGGLIYPGWERATGGSLNTSPTSTTGPADGIFRWVFGADWDYRTFDYDHDMQTVTDLLGPIINSMDADLGRFQRQGGKLIMYHGWADTTVVPRDTVFYFNRIMHTENLTLDQTRDFVRLFMAPGMGHCGGGVGPNYFDALEPLTRWVEQGVAPTQFVATKFVNNSVQDNTHSAPAPVGPAVERTRLLCAYPEEARYVSGDPTSASSFGCTMVDQHDSTFETPVRDYYPPLVVQAKSFSSVLDLRNGGSGVLTVVLNAPPTSDDFLQWQISNLQAEGVPAITANLLSGRVYLATFPVSGLIGFTGGRPAGQVVDLTITGHVSHNGNPSSFATSIPVKVMR